MCERCARNAGEGKDPPAPTVSVLYVPADTPLARALSALMLAQVTKLLREREQAARITSFRSPGQN